LLDYCQSDVDALARLLPEMLPEIDLPRALLRGRYMASAARMEWTGVPIDVATLTRLRTHWERLKGRLIAEVDRDYHVFLPAGQHALDPNTQFGAAVLTEAQVRGLDPYPLAEVAEELWRQERANVTARNQTRSTTSVREKVKPRHHPDF